MVYFICRDYFKGLLTSLRLDLIISTLMSNIKIRNTLFNIFKFNFIIYILPELFMSLTTYFGMYHFNFGMYGISIRFVIDLLYYPINLFSNLFHLFHGMYLINLVCQYATKSNHQNYQNYQIGSFDIVSLIITTSIYNSVMYLTNMIINYILLSKFYWLSTILNFALTSIYHSFYCFNNLWQYKKLNMKYRIDIHEKIWPYYLGYGTVATFLLYWSNIYWVLMIYNIYLSIIMILPFLTKPVYPNRTMNYFSINLSIFSYVMKLIIDILKKFF